MAKGIPKRAEDYSRWYTELVQRAELADYAPVKGCMVIRPYGYAIWEKMQSALDAMFKATGHVNAYFPLFIPESFMKREADHVKGFAPQCAVVTHGGGAKLEEPLYVRPTSETMIWSMYGRWIHSYRDLPLLINQWCNIVRWEMRPRLFLRTIEFLWQEGHTAHATEPEAVEETLRMLEVYRTFAEGFMAIPVIKGIKTESEKFAGAVRTYCIEAMMQDGKALQAGTSHYLGRNFARAFNVQFQNQEGKLEYVYATSWGVSTRLIGALVMAHSDDDGLVLPPKLAPIHVVVVPIFKDDTERSAVLEKAAKIEAELAPAWTVRVDSRENCSAGWKFNEWELKGVPIRIEIGPKDVTQDQAIVVRRDTREKRAIPLAQLKDFAAAQLVEMQAALFQRAAKMREERTRRVDDYASFKEHIEQETGGFALAGWCGSPECEAAIQEETKATIRCIPLDRREEKGACVRCGKPSDGRVVMAKAY